MTLEQKRLVIAALSAFLLLGLAFVGWIEASKKAPAHRHVVISSEAEKCITCHVERNEGPTIVAQWSESHHAEVGVGCDQCHGVAKDAVRPDAYEHYGTRIVTVVSPKDCSKCHQAIVDEFQASRHSEAAKFIGSLDNMLGEVVEGTGAAASGCQQCHGSTVKVLADGRLDPASWPNTGIGRVNPDGSRGSCSACHSRHTFSKQQARNPETCGKCHMGPDHPQIEIYNESKHGINFAAWRTTPRMNLGSDRWVVGQDYTAAPTCATCHMSATPTQPVTHDVGKRISWTLRPTISTRLENHEAKREAMQDVCNQCHAAEHTKNFYTQYDEVVRLYNEKFARPALWAMDQLRARHKITPTAFDDRIEWTYYELWHHEGRRARMGASMMGPDYTQWHGMYEVAKHFYTKFIPELRELGANDLADSILAMPDHRWSRGMTKEEVAAQVEFYRSRYGQGQ